MTKKRTKGKKQLKHNPPKQLYQYFKIGRDLWGIEPKSQAKELMDLMNEIKYEIRDGEPAPFDMVNSLQSLMRSLEVGMFESNPAPYQPLGMLGLGTQLEVEDISATMRDSIDYKLDLLGIAR